jgi:hypothetical protein
MCLHACDIQQDFPQETGQMYQPWEEEGGSGWSWDHDQSWAPWDWTLIEDGDFQSEASSSDALGSQQQWVVYGSPVSSGSFLDSKLFQTACNSV